MTQREGVVNLMRTDTNHSVERNLDLVDDDCWDEGLVHNERWEVGWFEGWW